MKNKNLVGIIFLSLFIILSIMYIHPEKQKNTSGNLRLVITKNESTEIFDYVDSDGNHVLASDKGYATKRIDKGDNFTVETFYDDKGEVVENNLGCSEIIKVYNSYGDLCTTSYFDSMKKPVIISEGYAVEQREYNKEHEIKSIRYFDHMNKPVCSILYGHGMNFEYNENGSIKTTYIDVYNNPTLIAQGYSSTISNSYIINDSIGNKAEKTFYFNENGSPICLALGQSGVYTEYDNKGRAVLWTFLDRNGKPMITKKGYTTVKVKYSDDGTVIEQYYDTGGNAVSIGEGRYGIKTKDGLFFYLDKTGHEQFNIKSLIYNKSWLAIVGSFFLFALSSFLNKKMNIYLSILYMLVIAYFTLLYRYDIEAHFPEMLWSYRKILIDSNARADIIKNIWLFIPLGFILTKIYPHKRIIFLFISISIVIEGIQLFTGFGICELDDIISNSLGGCIGFYFVKLTEDFIQRIKSWRCIHIIKRG